MVEEMRLASRRYWRAAELAALAAIAISTASCDRGSQAGTSAPPPAVTVSYPLQHEVIQWDDYSGYLSSPDTANVAPRVNGLIVSAPFKEGSLVSKGDVLFIIDDRPFKADLDSKKADVAKAQAQVDVATATLHRMDKVRNTRAISEEDYDNAKANFEQANASLAAANAALETSQLNLDWTRVTAPIAGRVGRQMIEVGNLVIGGGMQGQPTQLTTIVSVDPLYCYINVPERAALRYQDLAAQERRANVANAQVPCFVQIENETNYPHEGVVDFMDNRVDVNTGTVQIRGLIPNPGGLLTPGLFARMRIPGSGRYEALLIPDAAVGTEQNERFVLIVGPDNAVRRQPVKLGAQFGTLRSIIDGLKPGELVIVNGLQHAMPGAKVNPQVAPISAAQLEALESTLPGSPTTRAIPKTQPTTEP
jgi:RND family efflux transporter MFP subunit